MLIRQKVILCKWNLWEAVYIIAYKDNLFSRIQKGDHHST